MAPTYFILKTKQEWPYVKSKDSKNGLGATFGFGSMYFVTDTLLVDLFLDYLYAKRTYIDDNSQVEIKLYAGGLIGGIGIGLRF